MNLITGLKGHWKLDEVSGTRVDSHGPNDLEDVNGVPQGAGKINEAAQFAKAQKQALLNANNLEMSSGDVDFTVAIWVNLDSLVSIMSMINKNDEGTFFGWEMWWNGIFKFAIYTPGGNFIATATTFGTPSVGDWNLIVAWHDSVGDTVNIQVNDEIVESTATTDVPTSGIGPFAFGSFITNGSSDFHLDGRLNSGSFWKRLLTSAERSALHNGGAGLDYPFGVATIRDDDPVRIMWDNHVRSNACIVTPSSALLGLPGSNIKQAIRTQQWRSQALSAPYETTIDFDLGEDKDVTTFLMVNHDLGTGTPMVQITGATNSSFSPVGVEETVRFDSSMLLHTLIQKETFQYWRLTLTSAVAATNHSIGHVFLGEYFSPDLGADMNFEMRVVDQSRSIETQRGQMYSSRKPRFREVKVDFQTIDETELTTFVSVLESIGVNRPVFFALDAVNRPNTETFYGRVGRMDDMMRRYYEFSQFGFTFQEAV